MKDNIKPEGSHYDILLIEDDLATIRLLTGYFESEGVTCKGVISGTKGLEELVKNSPKIVILDIILPDYSGYDICKKIKSIQKLKNIPVFLFPSIGLKNAVEKHLAETKADGYILKPFKFSDFDGILDLLKLHKNKDESTKNSKTPGLTDEEILTLARLIHDGKKNMGFYSRSYPEKLMKTSKLRIERLDASRSGRSLCYVDQSIMESLGIATGDIIEIVGKKRTAGIVVASLSDKGKEIIRIDGIQRLNLGSTIGEFVTIKPTLASPAREIELAPTKAIYNIKKQADVIKGKLIDKPIMAGDIIDIAGAFIKSDENYAPMNGFMRMLNMGGGSKRPTLGSLRLIVLNTKPNDEVVKFTRDTRVKINKKCAILNSSGNLVTSDDIVGLEKEIFEIKKLLELSYNHPSVTEKLNIEQLGHEVLNIIQDAFDQANDDLIKQNRYAAEKLKKSLLYISDPSKDKFESSNNEPIFHYLKKNSGKAFTAQSLYNRIDDIGLEEEAKASLDMNALEEILINLYVSGKITRQDKEGKTFYFF